MHSLLTYYFLVLSLFQDLAMNNMYLDKPSISTEMCASLTTLSHFGYSKVVQFHIDRITLYYYVSVIGTISFE